MNRFEVHSIGQHKIWCPIPSQVTRHKAQLRDRQRIGESAAHAKTHTRQLKPAIFVYTDRGTWAIGVVVGFVSEAKTFSAAAAAAGRTSKIDCPDVCCLCPWPCRLPVAVAGLPVTPDWRLSIQYTAYTYYLFFGIALLSIYRVVGFVGHSQASTATSFGYVRSPFHWI